jgi:hypothetical protein
MSEEKAGQTPPLSPLSQGVRGWLRPPVGGFAAGRTHSPCCPGNRRPRALAFAPVRRYVGQRERHTERGRAGGGDPTPPRRSPRHCRGGQGDRATRKGNLPWRPRPDRPSSPRSPKVAHRPGRNPPLPLPCCGKRFAGVVGGLGGAPHLGRGGVAPTWTTPLPGGRGPAPSPARGPGRCADLDSAPCPGYGGLRLSGVRGPAPAHARGKGVCACPGDGGAAPTRPAAAVRG